MNKYIGENRLTYLWGKIKAFVSNAISGKVDKVSSSTDNAVVRFDGTGGAIQDSSVTIADTGILTVGADVIVKGSSTNTNTGRLTSNANSVLSVKNSSGTVLCSVTNADFKRGSSVGDMNLGSSAAPWNNAYAKKWITDGGTSSQFVKGDGSLDSTSYLQTGVIQPTNPFSGDSSKFYLEPVMDCMYEANRRWVVEGIITDSSTSPATETSLTTTEKNGLFGGDYGRVGVYLGANKTLKLTIKAAADPDTATLAVYGYGRIILNFYNYGLPLSVSGRLYYGSPSGTKSWTTFSFSTTRGGLNGIYVGNYFSVNYPRAIELTIAGQAVTNDPRSTNLSSVEWWISRASISQYPILTKYAIAQQMYGNLTAPKFITSGGTSSQFVKGDGSLDSTSYAPLASPALTGTPTAPTAAAGTNTTQIATTAFVQSAVPKDYQVDYSKTYLTFEALESGTFTFTGYSTNTVSYSTDDGKTWTSLASATASPTISAGDRIMWKASGLSIDSGASGIGTFSATGNFNIEGNAMSLASGDDFIGETTISVYQFRTLFKNNTKLISAENLILPATTASIGCYREMFYGCTGLTTPPELPATTVSSNCYDYMFYDCTSLKTAPKLYVATLANNSYRSLFSGCTLINYIECLATDISASNCTQYITRDVASTGTFVIADGMTSWQRNYHGIPSGWIVRTKSEMEHVTKGELDDVVGDIETLLASI